MPPTTMTPPATTSNTELIRWAFDVLNTHDVTPLKEFWTDDTVEHFPQRTCRGADEIASYFEDTFAAMPDFHIQVITIAGEAEDVFAHWRATGTHTGAPFLGYDPSGRAVALEGIDHFVLRDGMVVSNTVVFDQLAFARQIGLLPAQDSPGDRATRAAFNAKTQIARRLRRSRG